MNVICKKCGRELKVDENTLLLSCPPKRKCKCPQCGNIDYMDEGVVLIKALRPGEKVAETIEVNFKIIEPEFNPFDDIWNVEARVNFKENNRIVNGYLFKFNVVDEDEILDKEKIEKILETKKEKLIELATLQRALDVEEFWEIK